MNKKTHLKLQILVGPTGVGKSEVAFLLAQKWEAEILSADAFQVYKGLEVGTAQPSRKWQKEIPHHLVGTRDPRKDWNAVEFAREASRILQEGQSQGKRFILVGGSGFYLRALVEGPPQGQAPRPEIRVWVLEKVRELGNVKAQAWLKERDPAAAQRLHPNDLHRICRALEKTYENGTGEAGYRPLGDSEVSFWGLERSRDRLDLVLKARVESMWKNGLLNEARRLSHLELPPDHPIWGAIGYAEALAFQNGDLLEREALERIFRRTRQYAKRQWTWFKHQHKVRWINLDDYENMGKAVNEIDKMMTAG